MKWRKNMKKFGEFICKNKIFILIITIILFFLSLIGIYNTKINYDILVYLPKDIETVIGEDILTNDFDMGSFSIITANDMSPKEILSLEKDIKNISGVNKVISLYDAIGTDLPKDYLPSEFINKISTENSDILFVTFNDSTSSITTLNAVEEIRNLQGNHILTGGMSSMVLDTMNLSNKEIAIYIVIAISLCLIVLELSLDSYIVPIILLSNIGISLVFNLGTNFFLGDISYITKALVAVLQLGVTTDFSIFLYHAYERNKLNSSNIEEAMAKSIKETFTSVSASSITTIAGFLVLCAMQLKLGENLGLVMAKGVLLGLITVITIFPSLLLVSDKLIEKTKHKSIIPNFNKLNTFIVKHHKVFFIIFLILMIPSYLSYKKVDVYYKIDESLPKYLESVKTNESLKENFNIVSPEIIILNKDVKDNTLTEMITELKTVDGIDFILSKNTLSEIGLSINFLPDNLKEIFISDKYQLLLLNSTYDIATDELNNQSDIINEIIKKYDKDAILAGEGPLMKDLITISDTDFINVNIMSIVCILLIMVIALKSIILPILLVASIEFAIFMNMGISYLKGATLPFIAPIVLGTIQLGATIDYAILLTTTYLENKKIEHDKSKAMITAINQSSHSIIVSGLCFFAATIGVGIYSEIDLVGSICTLISRGALISMFVVIFILPGILLIFDKLIEKTTFGKKEKNMKKTIKKTGIIAILLLSLFTTIPVNALTKNETVYTKIDETGKVISTTVNDKLINNNNEDILNDLTDLENILNISSDNSYQKDNNTIAWNALGNDITYQGITNKSLPITMSISYKLDGIDTDLENMLGKKGHIEITLKYQNNEKHLVYLNGTNTYLYTPFIITMGSIIKDEGNSNLEITNGKIINNGLNNILISLSSPGLYESLNIQELKDLDTIKISYDTESFELPTIYNIATSKLLEDSDLSVFDRLSNLTSKTNLLKENIDKLSSGSQLLLDSSIQLNNGTGKIYESLVYISSKITELNQGIISIDEGLNEILIALNNAKNLVNNSSDEGISSIKYLIETDLSTANNLKLLNDTLKTNYDNFKLNDYTYEEVISIDSTLNLYNIKYTYESSYQNNLSLINLLNSNATALEETLNTLNSINSQIDNMLSLITSSLETIKSGTSNLTNGSTELSNGLNTLTEKTNELYNGTTNLTNGINTLNEGINSYNEEGITPLTNTINYSLQGNIFKIKKLSELGNNYKSFTMKNSTDDGETKFIIILDGKKPQENITKAVENKEEKTTFFTRIKNLFK